MSRIADPVAVVRAIEQLGGEATMGDIAVVIGLAKIDDAGRRSWYGSRNSNALVRTMDGLREQGRAVKLPYEGGRSDSTYALCTNWLDGVRQQRDRCEQLIQREPAGTLRHRRLSVALDGLRVAAGASA